MIYNVDCISNFIFVESELSPCEVILVPGGSRPQLAEKAAELYHHSMAKFILFSGGANPKIPDFLSEADYLKSVAVNLGVPAKAILCEHKAAHTFENAAFSLALLENMKLKTDRFILVCKAFHSRRALLTYQYTFPKSTEFFVASTKDNRGLHKENWTENDRSIQTVMGEVEKIGRYFCDKIGFK